MAATVVIQTKQGIGDVMWHLPFIRAIAGVSPGGAVTFLSPPSTHARDLLRAEPSVARTLYFENRGSELKRGLDLFRLVATLRGLACERVWILDRTIRPALAALLARIPHRIGLGLGAQRRLITNEGVDPALAHALPIEWLRSLMESMNVPCPTTEPNLRLPLPAISAINRRYGDKPEPWIVLALGGSHPAKDWPIRHWAEFLGELRRRTSGTVFLIGGAAHASRADALISCSAGALTINACNLTVLEAAALLYESDLFVGPDSGPMNLAAGVGIPAFGLFGATRVLTYSKFIHAVVPDDGGPMTMDGMQRISPGKVLERIEPYLAALRAASVRRL